MLLSDYCSGYLNVAEITTKGYQTSLDLRINRRVEDDFQTGLRSYIFSPKLFYIGLAYDEESRFQVIFFLILLKRRRMITFMLIRIGERLINQNKQKMKIFR